MSEHMWEVPLEYTRLVLYGPRLNADHDDVRGQHLCGKTTENKSYYSSEYFKQDNHVYLTEGCIQFSLVLVMTFLLFVCLFGAVSSGHQLGNWLIDCFLFADSTTHVFPLIGC